MAEWWDSESQWCVEVVNKNDWQGGSLRKQGLPSEGAKENTSRGWLCPPSTPSLPELHFSPNVPTVDPLPSGVGRSNSDTFPSRCEPSEQINYDNNAERLPSTHARHRVFCQKPLIVKDGEKTSETRKNVGETREKSFELIVLAEQIRPHCQLELKHLFSSGSLSSKIDLKGEQETVDKTRLVSRMAYRCLEDKCQKS